MKKTIISLLLIVVVSVGIPMNSFAETTETANHEITNVEAFKEELNELIADDCLSSAEKTYLEEHSEDGVIESFIFEKMDEAVTVLNEEDEVSLEEGQFYHTETYDLGDGCSLTVELTDEAAVTDSGITSRATSGSSTLWKSYGSRYFTASATVNFSLGTVTMKLRNYYVLSSKGIDEDYGEGFLVYDTISGTYSVSDPEITDSIARTVGASDVNMECKYTLKYSNEDNANIKKVYKITSTVGFVDIDKTEEKVKVKQSWKLTSVS